MTWEAEPPTTRTHPLNAVPVAVQDRFPSKKPKSASFRCSKKITTGTEYTVSDEELKTRENEYS